MADILAEEDELGLLADVKPARPRVTGWADPAIAGFRELLEFCREHGREPDVNNPDERALAYRLDGCRKRPDLRAKIEHLDDLGLLAIPEKAPAEPATPVEQKEPATMAEIFADDDLGLLDDVSPSIIRSASRETSAPRDLPDFIASRKPCEDFYQFENFFNEIQRKLQRKEVRLQKISSESAVAVGQIFIVRGQLCYVHGVIDKKTANNPRLRVIFQNGTEIDILKLSLLRALYKDKQSKRLDFDSNLFAKTADAITPADIPTGHIYILRTQSADKAIAALKNAGRLVKIGYTSGSVDERIKHAADDPTFLEAPVIKAAVLDCFNLNPQKFENLIHAFLHNQRLTISMTSSAGKKYQPKEWFTVDVDTAVQVCKHIIDGTIKEYRMDNTRGVLVKK